MTGNGWFGAGLRAAACMAAAFGLHALVASVALGATDGNGKGAAPEKRSPVVIARVDTPPVIDGRLDDEAWKHAAVLANFVQVQPGDNTQPLAPTEVYLAYDSKTLYIAYHCHDDPSKVRATVARRET